MRWSELIGEVANVAESIFSRVEDFKKGKLTVEVEGKEKLVIVFEKDAGGKLNGKFEIFPVVEEKPAEEAKEDTKEDTKKEESGPKFLL